MRAHLRKYAALAVVIGVSLVPAASSSGVTNAERAAAPGRVDAATTESTPAAAVQLPWERIGGPYGSAPTTLPELDVVFAVGEAGDPYYQERIPGGWTPPQPLDGQLESVVAPAEQLIGDQPVNFEIFGIGVDSAVWHRTRMSGWESYGGTIISSPTAVIWDGVTYVFGVGLDQAVWYRSTTSGWYTLGGQVWSDLAVTTDGTGLYVLGLGADGALWGQRLTDLTWSGWESLGGQLDSALSTTYTPSTNTGYVFGIGTDGGVWYQGVSGGAWSGWYGLGGQAASAPAAVNRGDVVLDTFDVYVIGTDLAMYGQRWNGSQWLPAWRHDGGGFTSNPAGTGNHVLGLGFDDGLWVSAIP